MINKNMTAETKKEPVDNVGLNMNTHVLIKDITTGEILVNKRG